MTMTPRRLLAAVTSGAIMLGGIVLATPAASAAGVVGTARPSVTTGTTSSAFSIVTSGVCPEGDSVQTFITGSGFPEAGYPVTSLDSTSTVRSGSGYSIPLLDTLAQTAADQDPAATLRGIYTFTVSCRTGFSQTSLADFTGQIVMTDATNWAIYGQGAGTASISPTTGTNNSTLTFATTSTCGDGDQVQVRVTGAGFPVGGYFMSSNDLASSVRSGAGYSIPLLESMGDAMAAQDTPVTLTGRYDLSLLCYTGLSAVALSETTTSIYFTSGTAFQSTPLATGVALSATGPVNGASVIGDSVTFTATVTVSGGVKSGTVVFSNGTTVLDSESVTASGESSTSIRFTTEGLAVGSYAVTAKYTPSDTTYAVAESSTSRFVIQAASGTVTVVPSTGTSSSSIDLTTTTTCALSDDFLRVTLFGSGFPANGEGATGLEDVSSLASSGSGYRVPLLYTMSDIAAQQDPVPTLSGKYTFVVRCYADISDTVGTLIGRSSIWFTTSSAYQSTGPIETGVQVVLSAASVVDGASVTMTANVTPDSATGSVEFFTKLGEAAAVSRGTAVVTSGTATRSLVTTGLGGTPSKAYKVYAVFTPTDGRWASATSVQRDLSVSAQVTTTTTLTLSAATAVAGASITMTATVSPSSASGTVEFFTKLGAAAAVSRGTATVSSGTAARTLVTTGMGGNPGAAQAYKVYAVFTPSTSAWGGSTSAQRDLAVTTAATPAATVNPAVTATARVGTALSCTIGTWTGAQSYAVVIKVAGVSKATRAKGASTAALAYTPVAADLGKAVTCEVTAYNDTFTTQLMRASTSVTVQQGVLTPSRLPTWSGTLTVGKTVTVSSGTWAGATTFAYQWVTVSGGKATNITNANRAALTLTAALRGKVIAVVVRASAPGLLGTTQVAVGTVK